MSKNHKRPPGLLSLLLAALLGPRPRPLQLAEDKEPVFAAEEPQRSSRDWIAHWRKQGQPWRREPEIDAARQQELAARRGLRSDVERGVYPFRSFKLRRADVEWLLASQRQGQG